MIETSLDLLYLILSICIALFTFFVCVMLYYFVMSLRDMRLIVKGAKDKVEKLHNVLESGFGHLGLVGEGVKMLAEYFIEKKVGKKGKKMKRGK